MSARFQTMCFQTRRARQLGVTLIELMISLLLGLLVIGGVLGIFLANREANRDTESLARIQESARLAFDMMGSALREIGGNPCGVSPNRILVHRAGFFVDPAIPPDDEKTLADLSLLGKKDASLLGVIGKEYSPGGTFTNIDYKPGTDSIRILSAGTATTNSFANSTATPVEKITATSLVFLPGYNIDFLRSEFGEERGVYLLCDYSHGVIDTGLTSAPSPGSSFSGLDILTFNTLPPSCPAPCPQISTYLIDTFKDPANPMADAAKPGTFLSRLMGTVWFVGKPEGSARSGLYVKVGKDVAVEVAPNVIDMELEYLLRNDAAAAANPGQVEENAFYVDAGDVADRWHDVVAVRATLTLVNDSDPAVPNHRLFKRTLSTTISLRNRLTPPLVGEES
jgi:type IV pilus assembly protein PilW